MSIAKASLEDASKHEASRIGCRPAESRDDYCQAFRLLYRQYYAAGLTRRNSVRMRISPHQLLPECETLVVERDRRIVGTLSLIGDGANRLPLDHYFPESLNRLRQRGFALIEVGCLAADDRTSEFPSPAYSALTRATIQHSLLGGFDLMVAAVHPRHCKLYEHGMGFRRVSDVVTCDLVEGNLAVCVVGDPGNPLAYRQPWRNIFFGGHACDFVQRQRRMSSLDRCYFEKLLEISQRENPKQVWRAA